MSHISDLIGVLRGLRLVTEAGAKLQQEACQVIWNNSSIKNALQNVPPVTFSQNAPSSAFVKDILEKAMVVGQGLRQYSVMQVPDLKTDSETSEMDPQLKEEIDELNSSFNKTFESLRKAEIKAGSIEFVAPLEPDPVVQSVNDVQEQMVVTRKQQVTDDADSSISNPIKPIAKKKIKVSLSENSKARVVPSSRISRMISFGSLAAGLGVGTVAQYARNTIQSVTGRVDESANAFMSPANAERIVDTLCKVRGAALKLGQLLSIQDEAVISPELARIFERVRQSADFMPAWQVQKVMAAALGDDWRSRLQTFDDKPFAAASIGQVHLATLLNGREVAMKVQYPGVAKGIDSDIDNLVGVMKVWNVFPKGMFIDNIVSVAKKELAWEVDYIREAKYTKKFKRLLKPYPEFFVPDVIEELCSADVITTELVDGVPLEKFFEAPYETRRDIAEKIMRLCLNEMFALRCMQTDPNWANFFYNPTSKQVILLDFGATREYSKQFMDQYIEVIKAAADSDRDAILNLSKEMKLLSGYESKLMEQAHVDTVMIMGEVFTQAGEFDFGAQKTTRRIQALVPTIINYRLCPPPEEIYSLHRKLSGVFLLCTKMKIKINCRDMFTDIYHRYKAGGFPQVTEEGDL